jgi:hypothetical protein
MGNDHVHPIFARLIDDMASLCTDIAQGGPTLPPVKPSLTVPCPTCWGTGGTDTGLCRRCSGTSHLWTNGGGR